MFNFRALFTSVFAVCLCFCKEELRCKPKAGCRLAQCDPSPARWAKTGSDVSDWLEKKEFPIVCESGREDELKELRQEIQNLRAEFNQMIKKLDSDASTRPAELCEVVHSNVCYWTHVQSSRTISFPRAESICGQKQSTVADILDRSLYDFLIKKIQSKIPKDLSHVYIWIGLKQNPSNGIVTLSSGVSAPYVKWFFDQPTRQLSETHMLLQVDVDVASSRQGMLDANPLWIQHGVVCQRKIN